MAGSLQTIVRARDIMTRGAVTIPHTSTVAEAAALLEEEEIHGAPVVNSYGKLIGVVSRTDIARHLRESLDEMPSGRTRSILEALIAKRVTEDSAGLEGLTSPVQEAMSERPITAGPDATAGELAELMHREGIHRVFIVQDDRLAGVVSAGDLMNVLARYERERRG